MPLNAEINLLKDQHKELALEIKLLRESLFGGNTSKGLDTAIELLQYSVNHIDDRLKKIEEDLPELLSRAVCKACAGLGNQLLRDNFLKIIAGIISVITLLIVTIVK